MVDQPASEEVDLQLPALIDRLPCAVAVRDSAGWLVLANGPYEEIVGIPPPKRVTGPQDLAPLKVSDVYGRTIDPPSWPAAAALRAHAVHDLIMSVTRPDRRKRWLRVDSKAVQDPVRGTLTLTTYLDVTDRWEVQQRLRTANRRAAGMVALLRSRHQEQAGIAELGQLALVGTGVQPLMERAVALVASTLDADRVRLLELLADGKNLLLRAGMGWGEGLVGTATISLGNTQAGYLFESNEPLVIEDFRQEHRFEASHLLQEHPVTSGIRVIIRGASKPFGELAAYTREFRRFTEDDVLFMRAVANTLAEAFIRLHAESDREQSLHRLEEVDQERKRLLQRLSSAVEAERRRIAGDIHDDSLQVLAGVGMRLQLGAHRATDPELKKTLEEANSALADAGRRLRRVIFDLRPDTLELGLAPALRFYFEQTATGADPELVIEASSPGELAWDARLMVYRACQEAINNVRKHSGARHAWIRIEPGEGGVQVAIEDDGKGFDASQPSPLGHLGLIAMRERIQLVGGRVEIAGGAASGTVVRFWIPDPSPGPT